MAENSHISWCDHTFNPWMGCTKVSPGCKHCYAETLMDTQYHKVEWGPQGTRVKTSAGYWKQPLKWNAAKWWQCKICGARWNESDGVGCGHNAIDDYENAEQTRQRVFCASLADVFEEKEEIRDWRLELFELIEKTPNLDWLILTKRPENIIRLLNDFTVGDQLFVLLKNVWIGVSVENQREANRRIPLLQKVPAKARFLSCEPLLDFIDLSAAIEPDEYAWDEINADFDRDDEPEEFVEECEAELDWVNYGSDLVYNPEHREWAERRRARAGFKTLKNGALHWVICGGESGKDRREMEVHWAEILREECKEAGVPFFMKQDSALKPGQQGRLPEELWGVKEFPTQPPSASPLPPNAESTNLGEER